MNEGTSNIAIIVGSLALIFALIGVFLIAFPQIGNLIVTYIKAQLPA